MILSYTPRLLLLHMYRIIVLDGNVYHLKRELFLSGWFQHSQSDDFVGVWFEAIYKVRGREVNMQLRAQTRWSRGQLFLHHTSSFPRVGDTVDELLT